MLICYNKYEIIKIILGIWMLIKWICNLVLKWICNLVLLISFDNIFIIYVIKNK